jgi:hypothetical protein
MGFNKLPFPKLYSPIIAFFMLGGVRQLLRNRDATEQRLFVFLTWATLGGLLGMFLPYYFQDFRFFTPVLPLLLITASVGAVSVSTNFCTHKWTYVRRITALCLGVLLLADLGQKFLTKGILRNSDPPSRTLRYTNVEAYNTVAEENAVIMTTLDPLYASHFVLQGTSRTYLPFVRAIHYIARDPQRLNFHWRALGLLVAADNPHVIADLLRAGLPVYTDDLKEKNYKKEYQKLRSLFDWQVVREFGQYHIYRLRLKETSVGLAEEHLRYSNMDK